MDNVDRAILLALVFFGSYFLFDRLVFPAVGKLNIIVRLQTITRFALLLFVMVIILYNSDFLGSNFVRTPIPYFETLEMMYKAGLAWIGSELILGILSSFTKNKQKDTHGI
ncbi:MAG: hypothetical protein AAF217_02070 [Pseudomonadota bacterium]